MAGRSTSGGGAGRGPVVVARALAAAIAVVVLLVGVPAALLTAGAGPLPAPLRSLDRLRLLLTSPDDGTMLLALAQLVAWLAWAVVAGCLLLEIVSQVRRVPTPALPALSVPQGGARLLVGAAAAVFLAAGPASAASAAIGPAPGAAPTVATSVAAVPGPPARPDAPALPSTALPSTAPHSTAPHVTARAPSATARPTIEHVVRPGDTLWTIAEHYLGDGARFREIAELNYDRPQPDGARLTPGHWVQPGWRLLVPAPPTADPAEAERVHVVRPGESLWQIADRELGDGDDWPAIYDANRGRRQPDGARLTDPDLVRPGWRLTVPEGGSSPAPAPPDTVQPRTAAPPAAPSLALVSPAGPSPAPASPAGLSLAPVSPAPVSPATPSPAGTSPTAPSPTAPSTSPSDPTTPATPPAGVEDDDSAAPWVAQTGGVGAVLAAGLIGTIGMRRRLQHLRRPPGRHHPMAPVQLPAISGPALTEQQLRASAEPQAVHAVDLALRDLADRCRATSRDVPDLRCARLGPRYLELYLAEPAALPAPWVGATQAPGLVWRLTTAQLTELAGRTASADVPAPYPALTTLGVDLTDHHVMVDLEHVGSLAVTGRPDRVRAALGALVLELATSSWADDVQVTVAGDLAAVEDALASGRIRYQPAVARALHELTTDLDGDLAALTAAALPDAPAARTRRQVAATWTPRVLVLAGDLTDEQRRQVRELADRLATGPRVAAAVVCTDASLARWSLAVPDDAVEPATLQPVGTQLFPQLLDDDSRSHVLQLLEESDPEAELMPAGSPLPGSGSGAPDAATPRALVVPPVSGLPDSLRPADPTSREVHDPDPAEAAMPTVTDDAPLVRVLGPVVVERARGSVEVSKKARLTELITFLALSPGARHREIDEAIWPDRRREDNLNTRNTATSKARAWLGRDDDGNDYLPRHAAGEGYRLLPSVTTDWDQWRLLVGTHPELTDTAPLEAALGLVRGRPFEGVHPRRYAWADRLRHVIGIQVVDVAFEVARRRVQQGRYREAESAIVIGLQVEPAWEPLWRLRIMAAQESGNAPAARAAADRLLSLTDKLGVDLDPATLAVLSLVEGRSGTVDLRGIAG